ncbi:hydantoinase/oxoprolinase family protein [Bombilactobacillus folatiphilus]|uniref:Hydantoinase/oxoprolinase family protein n=1 Tax=Bombilactobacillus folatiphilus TaxID=2923362 RepID=A0ABY4P8V3_9LACO|nr:hydantoinase/oxoprolinase family protein [Bombilactobacillus folatiphilus]UQS82160.1 hydantoinase/oxoprolinase family protein [Bombilactobacillus folatiphilus]
MYKLGIDVGGTNTDAVILDDHQKVVAHTKTHTTKDIQTGISNAIHEVVQASQINVQAINQAMLGTTQATNAIVERKNLGQVGVLRIGYPATASIIPYTQWPEDIVQTLSGKYSLIHGGYEFNGDSLAPFSESEIRDIVAQWQGQVDAIAIVGVFSSINDDQERRTAALVHEILGADFPVSVSSEIGSVGLIGRENATILNAALFKVIQKVTVGFSKALQVEQIQAQEYLCQNDGTLMSLDYSEKYPILTIGSGPTNSIRGAAYLSGRQNALVCDIGGTTSDIGALVNGFPRESSKAVSVGGVETNFRMPDILSVGLGGGSIVRKQADGTITVGPDSVGYAITERAKAFGGDTLTTTDIAVRLGWVELGDPSLVADVPLADAQQAMAVIQEILETGIDQMKTSAEDVSVILVGGGSIIAPKQLTGVSAIDTNQYGGVANAIGATIAQIGGEFEKMYQYVEIPREQALADATKLATERAVSAGALADTISVVEILETPLSYAPGETTKVKVKVVGNASLN